MMTCNAVRELIPWYVAGTLSRADAAAIDAHLETCDACRADLYASMRLRAEFKNDDPIDAAVSRIWETLEAELAPAEARLDVGSFLLGLSFGVTANRNVPLRGSLRVLGRDVRILGRKGRGS